MKNKKGMDWVGKIPKWAWLLISLNSDCRMAAVIHES